jgi:hypothetical protein
MILTVEKGKVINPIKTSGVVEPESEVLIRCSYPSSIKRILTLYDFELDQKINYSNPMLMGEIDTFKPPKK